MNVKVTKSNLEDIQPLRLLFLHEGNFQFIYNKCHLYGWADTYLFTVEDLKIGYGAVWGSNSREERDAIFEFFVIKSYRKNSNEIFQAFNELAGARNIECQSNDYLLSTMLFEFTQNINAEAILFEDQFRTDFDISNMVFKKGLPDVNASDRPYILVQNDEIVATGGLMLNYNFPYADLYYEVNENHRRKGLGTLMLQELKKEAYLMGRVPAARCNIRNAVSKSALLKSGFKLCGYILKGTIKSY